MQGPFSWFYTFVGFTGVGVISLIISHCLLAYGAYKENHKFLKKWLITNVIVFTVLLVFVLALLFTGFHLLKVNESQFIWILVIAGLICGLRFFSAMLIFQYRRNLMEMESICENAQSTNKGITY